MILKKISRYMALSSGDFQKIFQDFRVPSLPQVITKLLALLRNPEVSLDEVTGLIEVDPGLTAQILRVVNSAFVGTPQPIKNLRQAAAVLGLKKIENIAISFGVLQVVRDPGREGFDLSAFWTDSLFRALFARELAKRLGLESDQAFLAALLQDVALPVLLTEWFDVYQKAYRTWRQKGGRLSIWEAKILSWHHAQAGAWLAKKWSLDDLIVCGIGLHVFPAGELKALKVFQEEFALVALSSEIPSVLSPEPSLKDFFRFGEDFRYSEEHLREALFASYNVFLETASSFGLKVKTPVAIPDLLA